MTIKISGTVNLASALEAIDLHNGVSLTIAGAAGAALDGGGAQRGLFVYSGDVTVEYLTLQNMTAVGGSWRRRRWRRRRARRRPVRGRQRRSRPGGDAQCDAERCCVQQRRRKGRRRRRRRHSAAAAAASAALAASTSAVAAVLGRPLRGASNLTPPSPALCRGCRWR